MRCKSAKEEPAALARRRRTTKRTAETRSPFRL